MIVMMEWINLTSTDQVDHLIEESYRFPVLIFKFSSRCSASRVMLDRLERRWKSEEFSEEIRRYFLDLIRYRAVSDLISHRFEVPHESPQVLVIYRGKAIYDESHYGIDFGQIVAAAANVVTQT